MKCLTRILNGIAVDECTRYGYIFTVNTVVDSQSSVSTLEKIFLISKTRNVVQHDRLTATSSVLVANEPTVVSERTQFNTWGDFIVRLNPKFQQLVSDQSLILWCFLRVKEFI